MTAPRSGRGLTVQGWQNLVLAVMGVLVLTGAIVCGILLNRTDEVSSELVDKIQPARVAAYQLQAALRDQETALRGYAIAADKQFLEPYFEGQRNERAAADWRATYADPLTAGVRPGRPTVVDDATAERGKAELDQLRALFDTQN